MPETSPAPVDLDVLEAELPLHYFDCERFNVTDYGTRQGKCDCTATEDIRSLIAEVADLRSRAAIGPDPNPRERHEQADEAPVRPARLPVDSGREPATKAEAR